MATKTEIAVPAGERELPVIDPKGVTVNDAGQCWRNVLVRLPQGMIADDLRSAKVWKKVQSSRSNALIKYDQLLILGFDESFAVRASVTHASSLEANIAIEKVFAFKEQGKGLWSDGTLEVAWSGASYIVRRVADKVQIINEGFHTEAVAADAARRSYPTKVA